MNDPEDAYEQACQVAAEVLVARLRQVRAILEERPGWRFETDGGPSWHFGLEGASRLVVTVGDVEVRLYNSHSDSDRVMHTESELRTWLTEHEHEYEGFTKLQTELLGELLPRQIADWQAGQEGPET